MSTAAAQQGRAPEFDDFASTIRGRVLAPGTQEYEEARMVRNGLIDRRPAMIVRCQGTADVADAINFARDHQQLVSVRGGGHNVAGNAVNDGGIVIDLSDMRAVFVDPVAKRAYAQGGATWADVDRETQLFGLAAPGGVVSSTGIGGLTLHGGLGWLRRKHGLCIDNLRSVEIVTADGEVRTASASSNPDLYWAVRGAGSNFGVVTLMEFDLHPVGPEVLLTAPAYRAKEAPKVLRFFREFVRECPDEVSSELLFWSVPANEHFPEELHGEQIVMFPAVYSGDPDEGERILQPTREIAEPLLDLTGRMPYTALQSGFDWAFPKGWLYYWKSLYLNDLSAEAMEETLKLGANRPSPEGFVALWQLGGAMSRVPADATAFGSRDAPFLLSFDVTWTDAADSERCIAWTRNAWSSMQRFGPGGLYLNFAGFGEEKEALVRAGYGKNYDRLVEIKTTYDPANLFRMNQNIVPMPVSAVAD
ncbi:MAG: FAD-binding oxidoreductase [Thermomicrobiales bacterium]|nr:FAD-binding oxidoreductase [Thermomicrobiales bacterium]